MYGEEAVSEECRDELVEEALAAIREALMSFLFANCRRTMTMIELTGQKRVRLEFYALFRHYNPSENFPRLMDALSYVQRCRGLEAVEQVLGGEILEPESDEPTLVLESEKFVELCREALEKYKGVYSS